MVGACWDKDLMALVMEFCEKGMSSSVLKLEGKDFTWGDPLIKWCLDVARGMKYLHDRTYFDRNKQKVDGIIHRDLKPDNCLVSETYGIKIADFGQARAVQEDATMTQVGTPMFIAPEVVRGDYYGKPADVFSYAMTLVQFGLRGRTKLTKQLHRWLMEFQGKKATVGLSLGRITHNIAVKDWRPTTKNLVEELGDSSGEAGGVGLADGEGSVGIPKIIAELIGLCWAADIENRPTFEEILVFLETEAKAEIMGNMSGRTDNRRTSTTGTLSQTQSQMHVGGDGSKISEMMKAQKAEKEELEGGDEGAGDDVARLKGENEQLKGEVEALKASVLLLEKASEKQSEGTGTER